MIEVLRSRDRLTSAWKNGGGVTRVVAASPPHAGTENFGWRISLADVERAGPFSIFAGIDRKLAVLKGEMVLTIEGQGDVVVSPETEVAQFPGDAAVEALLTTGPVCDLNVMTRRSNFVSRLTRILRPQMLAVGAHTHAFVAVGQATLAIAERCYDLAELDVLMSDDGANGEIVVRSASAPLYWVEILGV